jgi:hypothetical protein
MKAIEIPAGETRIDPETGEEIVGTRLPVWEMVSRCTTDELKAMGWVPTENETWWLVQNAIDQRTAMAAEGWRQADAQTFIREGVCQ